MDGSLSVAAAAAAVAAATTTAATATSITSPLASSTIIEHNGITPPSPSTTPLSDDAGSVSGKLMADLGSSPDKPPLLDGTEARLELLKEVKAYSLNNNSISSNNNNNNTSHSINNSIQQNKSCNDSSSSSCNRVSPTPEKESEGGVNSTEPSNKDAHQSSSNNNNDGTGNGSSSNSKEVNVESKEAESEGGRTTKSLAEELSAKDREVSV